MIRKAVIYAVLIPLALVILMFAAANRQTVTVSFDPFSTAEPAFSLAMPLFVLIFVLLIVGVIVGGFAAWLRQGRHRRHARTLEREVQILREEKERSIRREAPAESSRLPYQPGA
ncbi:MAG TPA: LapA family protein [Pseudorhodoplanes sp.]|nr:LapA family protein [Pseudorhodoplanes sp.]